MLRTEKTHPSLRIDTNARTKLVLLLLGLFVEFLGPALVSQKLGIHPAGGRITMLLGLFDTVAVGFHRLIAIRMVLLLDHGSGKTAH